MNTKQIFGIGCLLMCLTGCSSRSETSMESIRRYQGSEMAQLSHAGPIWISDQPTEADLIWMRDNGVSLVLDVRSREDDPAMQERALVVTLGMAYQSVPLEDAQDYVIRYFDYIRGILASRRDVPTLIHGSTADRAAALWMVYRVLDDRVPYDVALAEARIAGLDQESTLHLVQQYLVGSGVEIDLGTGLSNTAPMVSEEAPDETIHEPAVDPEPAAAPDPGENAPD